MLVKEELLPEGIPGAAEAVGGGAACRAAAAVGASLDGTALEEAEEDLELLVLKLGNLFFPVNHISPVLRS